VFKKYWIIFSICLLGLILIAGCVSYLEQPKDANHNLGFYEIEQDLPKYSKSIVIPPKIIVPPRARPIIYPLNLSDSSCDFLDLTFYNNIAYTAYSDAKQNYKIIIKKFNGSDWENVGSSPITDDQAYWPNIEIINNQPVVFYVDRRKGYSISGKYFDGTWQNIPVEELPSSKIGILKTQSHKDSLFLAYSDSNAGGVVSAFWKNNQWTLLPVLTRYNHKVIDLDIVTIKNDVYLALIDSSVAYNILVYKLSNNNWDIVGHFSLVDYFAGDLSLATNGIQPYVSYITYKDDASVCKINVKKFNGKDWETVGNPFSTPGKARFAELQINKNSLFLAYADLENKKPLVLRLINNNWTAISKPEDVTGKTNQLIHFVYKNFSYVGYIDEENNYRATALPLPLTELP
jgi:hypothetical protein